MSIIVCQIFVPVDTDRFSSLRVRRRPTWGTCAGLILLAESANQTKKGGQDLIGGLDVRVNRNYFGRQTESFEADMNLSFLEATGSKNTVAPFRAIFIRAPVVEKLLPIIQGQQTSEKLLESMVVAPSRDAKGPLAKQRTLRPIEIMATLPGRSQDLREKLKALGLEDETGDVVAVKQGNVFGTSFHPELTQDARIHVWWLQLVRDFVDAENEI